jgi:hypothetical protein
MGSVCHLPLPVASSMFVRAGGFGLQACPCYCRDGYSRAPQQEHRCSMQTHTVQ